MLDQYEAANGKVNLSELLGEAVRRRTGQLNADELVAERATTAVTGVEKLQRELRALARRTAKLEKLAGVKA